MSALSGCKRRLKRESVFLATKVAEEKIKLARQVVLDRAQRDPEFAADVLKAVGDNLPTEIKVACEKSVATAKAKTLVKKWEKTELLDIDSLKDNPSIIVESEEKQLIIDIERTGVDVTVENHTEQLEKVFVESGVK